MAKILRMKSPPDFRDVVSRDRYFYKSQAGITIFNCRDHRVQKSVVINLDRFDRHLLVGEIKLGFFIRPVPMFSRVSIADISHFSGFFFCFLLRATGVDHVFFQSFFAGHPINKIEIEGCSIRIHGFAPADYVRKIRQQLKFGHFVDIDLLTWWIEILVDILPGNLDFWPTSRDSGSRPGSVRTKGVLFAIIAANTQMQIIAPLQSLKLALKNIDRRCRFFAVVGTAVVSSTVVGAAVVSSAASARRLWLVR